MPHLSEAASQLARPATTGSKAPASGAETDELVENSHFGSARRASGNSLRGMKLHEEFAQETARRLEKELNLVSQELKQTTKTWLTLMQVPAVASVALADLQSSLNNTVKAVVRTNLEGVQELFQSSTLADAVGAQQRLVRGYLDAFLCGNANVLRAVHHSANEILNLVEDRTDKKTNGVSPLFRERNFGRRQPKMQRVATRALAIELEDYSEFLDRGGALEIVNEAGNEIAIAVHPDEYKLLTGIARLAENAEAMKSFLDDRGTGQSVSCDEAFKRVFNSR